METDQIMKGYVDQIKEARYQDAIKVKYLCDELLAYSSAHRLPFGAGFAYTYLLEYHLRRHELSVCSQFMQRVREFHMDYDFDDLKMLFFNLAGIYYSKVHDDSTAFDYFLKGLELAQRLGDNIMVYRLYNNIAAGLNDKQDYETALCYYQRAYELVCRGLLEQHLQYQIYLLENMINCCIAIGDRPKVERYCRQFDRLFKQYPGKVKNTSILFQKVINLTYFERDEEAKTLLYRLMDEEQDSLSAADILEMYPYMFRVLLKWEDRRLAKKVLDTLCAYMEKGTSEERQEALIFQIEFYEKFGTEEELIKSFQNYYYASKEARKANAKNQTVAMKEKITYFEMNRKLEHFQYMSYMDELCGIHNRRYYEEVLRDRMRDEQVFSLGIIVVDIDCFKEYNDCYGHRMGDKVLKKIADCLNPGDQGIIPCRYGGDELCCVCTNRTEEELYCYLKTVYRRVHALAIPHISSNVNNIVTISCGFSIQSREKLSDVTELFQEADMALYDAKSENKGHYKMFRRE